MIYTETAVDASAISKLSLQAWSAFIKDKAQTLPDTCL